MRTIVTTNDGIWDNEDLIGITIWNSYGYLLFQGQGVINEIVF